MKRQIKTITNVTMVIGTLATLGFVFYGLKIDLFTSQSALSVFLSKYGIWAPLIFVLFQAVQVVFPVLPGGIGLLGGVLIFGPYKGFFYNYAGICLGSAVAFLLAKQYGKPILESLFSKKMNDKYTKWAENKNFPKLFTAAIFLPVAPDDFLCYLAGTTNMSFERFIAVILLGKPLAIAAYSFGLSIVFSKLAVFMH